MKPFLQSGQRIAELAWPVFIGQVSVVAFATVDTFLLGRFAAADLAALAVGGAIYITVFIGLMGAVLAVGPLAGQMFGAGRLEQAGNLLHQAAWLALALAIPGSLLLLLPQPFLALAQVSPEVEPKVRGYLAILSLGLPAALLFSAYRGFNTAVSRPKAVMVLQLCGLAIKIVLSVALIRGWPALGIPALGVLGCAAATVVALWLQALLAGLILRRDPFYDRFVLRGRGLHRPDRQILSALLKLGLPTGATLLVEVGGFSMMAIFISRMGTTPVAAHQIAVNLVSLMFMVPMALAQASGTLVAQHVGAGQIADARRLGWQGLQWALLISTLMGVAVFLLRQPLLDLYTNDAAVAAVAMSLLAWLVVFHVADAAQVLSAFVLRAWRIATVPMLIYVAALWGVGLGGGYALGFDVFGGTPSSLVGAPGYWAASTGGLVVAALALLAFQAWVMRSRT